MLANISVTRPTVHLLALAIVAAMATAPALLAVQQSSADASAIAAEVPKVGVVEPEAPLAARNLRIVGSALKPRQNGVTWATNGGGGCVYATASPSTVWNTPLYLPQGANVQTLRTYYNDTSASNFQSWFTIYDLYGAIVDEFSAPSVGATGQDFNDSLPINHVINYSLYSYAINYRPVATGSTLQFCGVRIFYEY